MKSKICMEDIRQRNNSLNIDYVSPESNNVNYLYENFIKHYSFNNAKLILEDWQHLSKENSNVAFTKVMDIFEAVCINGTVQDIQYIANYITEGILHKVRNGEQAEECVHRKIGKFTIPATKIKNNAKIVAKAAKDTIDGAKANLNKNIEDVKNKDKKAINAVKSAFTKKDDAVAESLQMILDKCVFIEQCDRVLNNHRKLSNRFDIDRLVKESSTTEDSINDCILELCNYIDTYNMPFGVKYNVALENIMYCFDKNCMPYSAKDIANTVTDYFLMNTVIDEAVLHDMNYIISKNKFYTDEDLSDVKFILSTTESKIDPDSEDTLSILEETKVENEKVKRLIADFKKLPSKTVEGLKELVKKMYITDPKLVLEETPNIFGFIRAFFIIGSLAINPILSIVTLITDYLIKMDLNRKEWDKIIIQYEKELEKTQKKIDKTTNEATKKRLEAYEKQIKDDIKKLETYADKFFTDTENDKRSDEKYDRDAARDARRAERNGTSSSSSNDDFNFSFDDIKFESADLTAASKIVLTDKLIDNLKDWDSECISYKLSDCISGMNLTDIDNIINIVELEPEMFNIIKIKKALEVATEMARSTSGIEKYMKIDCYTENINKLNNIKYIEKQYSDFDSMYNHYTKLYEACSAIIDTLGQYGNDTVIHELSVMNKLKLAGENLKKAAQKVSDVDKNVSRQVDMNVDSLLRNTERALSSSNREAVIRGSILPSASKTIKIAITTGAAFLIQPAVAVIGLLGYIAMSIKNRAKERDIILDEIEVELAMCEKYLRLAEDKNDMKAVKNIMQTKRALEKQRNMLRYYMKTNYNQHVMKNTDDDE